MSPSSSKVRIYRFLLERLDENAPCLLARDGYYSNPDRIFLTAGASAGVTLLCSMLISNSRSGILIPIPQYPLYTAVLAQFSGVPVPYNLDERSGWSTYIPDIVRAIEKARAEGTVVKAFVVINPGNPTGAVLD